MVIILWIIAIIITRERMVISLSFEIFMVDFLLLNWMISCLMMINSHFSWFRQVKITLESGCISLLVINLFRNLFWYWHVLRLLVMRVRTWGKLGARKWFIFDGPSIYIYIYTYITHSRDRRIHSFTSSGQNKERPNPATMWSIQTY